jgi:5-methylcytosine-specific restriction endonuclease McrA
MYVNNCPAAPAQAAGKQQRSYTLEFKLREHHHGKIATEELLRDVKETAFKLGLQTITRDVYDAQGRYNSATASKRLGNWNKVLRRAGLKTTVKRNITKTTLLKNIERVWIKLRRQPTQREMRRPLSMHCLPLYKRRFGSWKNALLAFVEFKNAKGKTRRRIKIEEDSHRQAIFEHKTNRAPGAKLKVQVLMRDGNKCRLCGATLTGDDIHFDHIIPWSKGGETTLENLQVLCREHNMAKGDLV